MSVPRLRKGSSQVVINTFLSSQGHGNSQPPVPLELASEIVGTLGIVSCAIAHLFFSWKALTFQFQLGVFHKIRKKECFWSSKHKSKTRKEKGKHDIPPYTVYSVINSDFSSCFVKAGFCVTPWIGWLGGWVLNRASRRVSRNDGGLNIQCICVTYFMDPYVLVDFVVATKRYSSIISVSISWCCSQKL